MSVGQGLMQAGQAIAQGIQQRGENKKNRGRLETILGATPDYEERKDDLSALSLGELQGLMDTSTIKRAEEIQKQQAAARQQQMEQSALQIQAMKRQAEYEPMARAQQQSRALLEQAAAAQKLHRDSQPLGGPESFPEMPGVYRMPLGNGGSSIVDLRENPGAVKEPPRFVTVEGPEGQPMQVLIGGSLSNTLGADGNPVTQKAGIMEEMMKLGIIQPPQPAALKAPASNKPVSQKLTVEEQQAIDWAKANPTNPDARQILKHYGL